jgi:hypothetical protein
MKHIQIDSNKMVFTENGRPFFYLADTAWMAFSNMNIEEWEEYTDFRKAQGFTAVQISILPILNDTSKDNNTMMPYGIENTGKMDFSTRNEVYFEKAERMVEIMVKKDLVPALAVLWNNYVPTAWAAERTGNISLMPESYLPEYASYVAKKFDRFRPMYLISGDTGFDSEIVTRYYFILLEEMKKRCPDALMTMHIKPKVEIPGVICGSKSLDFYMFQSGHRFEGLDNPFKLAEQFNAYSVKRPVVNGEPCYEGHSYGNEFPRFTKAEVRRAVWQSLLSGAKAGTAYGAHGIWMFQHKGMTFNNVSFSGVPFLWRDALQFEGAWDVSYAKWIFETYRLFDLEPNQSLVSAPEQVRAAAAAGFSRIAVYIPYQRPVAIHHDLSGYRVSLHLLDKRWVMVPHLLIDNGKTILPMSGYNTDVLLIAENE